ncbi:MAG: L-threonylcarbamoyladenylate synthase [Dehalococcoidia bacterium]
MVRIISADDPECLEAAAAVLRGGGLIVFPTDTVYGLGALARDDVAVLRLFRAKGRAPDRALPLLLADRADLEAVTATVPAAAETLMERFWPGGLTIVLPRSPRFHSLALAGGDTVGVRIPDHALAREMIRRAGGPIVGTSANRSGRASPLTVAEAIEQVEADLAVDGGRCRGGTESTVIDITTEPWILREGLISSEEIEEALGVHVAMGEQ